MRVRVGSGGAVELLDADVFTELAMTGTAPSSDTDRAQLESVGISVSNDRRHAFLDPAALERLAGERSSAQEWRSGFRTMVEYATSKGWVDDAGRIRAHWAGDSTEA